VASPWTRTQATPVASSTGTGSLGLVWGAPTVAGHNLIAMIAVNAPATPPDVTKPVGSEWVAGPVVKLASNLTVAVFYISAAIAHSGTETWGLSTGSRDMVGIMVEYAHSGGAGIKLDQSQTGSNTGSTSPSTGTTSGSTAGPNDLVVSVIGNVNTSTETSPAGTPTGTFATISNGISANATASSRVQGYFYENKATAAGTAETHATLGTSRAWAAVIAAFLPLYTQSIAASLTGTPAASRATSHGIAVASSPWFPLSSRSTAKGASVGTTLSPVSAQTTSVPVAVGAALTPVSTQVTSKPIAVPSPTFTPVTVRVTSKTLAVAAGLGWGRAIKRTPGKALAVGLTGTPAGVRAALKALALTSVFTPATNQSSERPGVGWGGPWGEVPWGGMVTPGIGGRPLIGRDEFPDELPPYEHRIIGPNGLTDSPEIIAGFYADEDVGFAQLVGTVEAERVRDQPDIYTDGAQWIVTDSSTGLVVAAGDLLTPAFGGGAAALKADGWAKRLLRKGERLMYAAAGNYGATWVPKNSEPFGPSGRGYYAPGSDKFQIDSNGALRWKISKGTDGWTEGDQHGFIAVFIGLRPGVTRVKGHLHSTVDGVNFRLMLYSTDSVEGLFGTGVELANFTSGGSDADFDAAVDPVDPVVVLQIERTTTGTTTQDVELTATGLWEYGIASDDRWSASDVGRDIAGRLGFATRIKESSLSVLPLDSGADGVYADPLDLACLLSGMFYRVLGIEPGIPMLEMRHIGSVQWEIIDPEFSISPIPLPRFDSVLVPYTLSNGVAQGVLEVRADSIDQPMLPISRAYGPISLPDPLPNADNAQLLGQRLLERVYPPRFAGQATFSRVYGDGGIASAHEVHSQDTIVLPLNAGLALQTKSLHREGGFAQVTFDDGALPVDRMVARKTRQILLKHPA